MQANFDAAWGDAQPKDEDWPTISEKQVKRLYAIAKENDWSDAALNRLIKDELGYESKGDLNPAEPYDEICEALEDERLRYHMSRDPDTRDMFEGQAEDSVAESSNAADFEKGTDDDDLPF